MKKLWIVIVFLLLLCGCSTKSQNAVIAGTPVETEREQAESAALSEVQETQENSEREESANHQTEADAQDDANEYLQGEETSAEETDAQEETAVSPSDKAKQEADAGNREKAEPLPAKPKLGDFLYASVPDDAFICELDKMWVDDTPIQWRIYTQPEEMEYCATGNAENAFAPVELTERIYIYNLPDTLEESSISYRNGALTERIGSYRTQIIVSREFDLDGCGERETIQLLYLRGSGGNETGVRIIKNDAIFDLEEEPMPYADIINMWLADLDADGRVELYLRMENGTVQRELLAWEFSTSGLQRLQFEGEESLSSAMINIKDNTLFVVAYTRVSGAHIALRRYCKSGQQIVPIDTEWAYAFQDADCNSIFGELAVLRVKESIPAMLADGEQTLLLPDTYLIITSGDEKSYMRFLTENGLQGTISFTEVNEYGIAFINGKWIDKYFDFYPRAE